MSSFTSFSMMGKVLVLTSLLVLVLFVVGASSQDVSSLLDGMKQQQQIGVSSLSAEEIKKVYDEKRKNLEALRKVEVSLLVVEEAVRKYGSNNLLYRQRLEKLKEISAVKRVLQNDVASLMFLCEEKKCTSATTTEEKPPQAVKPSAAAILPIAIERSSLLIESPQKKSISAQERQQIKDDIEQLFMPTTNSLLRSLSENDDFPGLSEPEIPEEPSIPEPSIPEPSVPGFPAFGTIGWQSVQKNPIVTKPKLKPSSAKPNKPTTTRKIVPSTVRNVSSKKPIKTQQTKTAPTKKTAPPASKKVAPRPKSKVNNHTMKQLVKPKQMEKLVSTKRSQKK